MAGLKNLVDRPFQKFEKSRPTSQPDSTKTDRLRPTFSSRESSGWLMSSFEEVFESSIFTEEKGPKSICGIFLLALDAGGGVSASLAGLEDLVSIIFEGGKLRWFENW